jgi:hypothetical protein
MIERIQSWLNQGVRWIGTSPRAWLAIAGLTLLVVVLVMSMSALRREKRRTASRHATPGAASVRASTDPLPRAAAAKERDPLGLSTPSEAQPSPARTAESPTVPAPIVGTPLDLTFHVLSADAPALQPTPTGAVAVAERPLGAAASTISAAEEAYQRAHELLAQHGGDAETLRTAVALLERVQQVWTREVAPERWAALHNDVGSAYQDMLTGDRTAHLREAIAHHESALDVFDPVRHAMSWAWTQSALAAAYQSLPTGSVISNARAAVAYHQRALDVFTPFNAPFGWAWNQNNLGAAYELMRNVSDGDRVRALRDAAACYAAALRVYTRANHPVLHQIVTLNLQRVESELAAIE